VLSGPTSLVVLEPPTHEWASLINTLWEEVVASSSITDLAGRLAQFKIDDLPSLAAFFWTDDGMRSLIRGDISVIDLATGKVVADGEASRPGARLVLPVWITYESTCHMRETPPCSSFRLSWEPYAPSSVTLDASQLAQVSSPQAEP
jgi:hypothetical protein